MVLNQKKLSSFISYIKNTVFVKELRLVTTKKNISTYYYNTSIYYIFNILFINQKSKTIPLFLLSVFHYINRINCIKINKSV